MASAPLLTLDLVQTLALAGCVLFLGYGVRRLLPALARVNVPAPVVGGLLAASLVWWGRSRGLTLVQLDTTLQAPLMIAFFTTIGFGASLSLLRAGGPAVAVFLGISTVLAVGQNLLGAALALVLGQHPCWGSWRAP